MITPVTGASPPSGMLSRCGHWCSRSSAGRWPSGRCRRRSRRPVAWSCGSRPAGSAAATGTPGRGTTPTSSCRTCPGTSWPARSPRSASGVRGWAVGDRVTVPVRQRLRALRAVRGRRAPGVHPADPARLHPLGLAGRARRRSTRPRSTWCALPDGLAASTAAALGCRYATAYRAVVQVGRVRPGEWVAVHGCGGVGLSAVQIAVAAGARVVAVDVSPAALELARGFGAERVLDGARPTWPPRSKELTGGGAHVSLDAVGAAATCEGSVRSPAAARPARAGRAAAAGAGPPRRPDGAGDRAASWRCWAATAWPRTPTRSCSASSPPAGWRPSGWSPAR